MLAAIFTAVSSVILDEFSFQYARLLEEKKKTYAEYRRSREEMRELLAAKANVEKIMEFDKSSERKETQIDTESR